MEAKKLLEYLTVEQKKDIRAYLEIVEEKIEAVKNQQYERAAQCRDKERKLRERIEMFMEEVFEKMKKINK